MLFLLPIVFAADAETEAAATRLYGAATTAFEQGDVATARRLLIELLSAYPDTAASKNALRTGVAPQQREAPVDATDREEADALVRKAAEAATNGDFAAARAALDELDARFPDDERTQGRARRMRAEVDLVGAYTPRLDVEMWFQGTADFGSAPATLVVFFEAWCPHCKNEMPKMEALSRAYGERMQVIGLTRVTRSATDTSVRSFLTELDVHFPIAKESGSMSTAFNVSGIPAAALIRDGVIVWRGHPAKLTDGLLMSLLR